MVVKGFRDGVVELADAALGAGRRAGGVPSAGGQGDGLHRVRDSSVAALGGFRQQESEGGPMANRGPQRLPLVMHGQARPGLAALVACRARRKLP